MIKNGFFGLIGFLIIFSTLLVSFSFFNPILSTSNSTITESESENLSSTVNNGVSYLREAGVPIDDLLGDVKIKEAHLPFGGFIQNLGQVNADSFQYYFSAQGLSVGFGLSTITFVSSSHDEAAPVSFSLTFPGSQLVKPSGREKKSHYVNYFYGDFQLTNVPTWDEIWYEDLYPGIHLCYYMSKQGLKYDFIVEPGADPSQIIVQVSESMTVSIIDQTVSLQSRFQPEKLSFQDTALQVFQADHKLIDAQFVPKGDRQNCYGFRIDSFDSSQTLTIDPLWLPFSTLLGGNAFDTGNQLVVDVSGNTFITGHTDSLNFPTYSALNSTTNLGTDVFVTKLNATGNGLVFSTYLGGSGNDKGWGIAVDENGNSYVSGETESSDFPTVSAYNSTHNNPGGSDVFVTKLNATGNGLVFSTYLGGSGHDYGEAIALDGDGNSYVTGYTGSLDFPNTTNTVHGGGTYDVFVTKLNAAGNGLVFSTYLGGSSLEYGKGIALDDKGNSYVTGYTWSNNFPMKNSYNSTYGGSEDVFVTKLNETGNGLNFSTYLGGNKKDFGQGIALDSKGNVYITGYTNSSNFPTQNAYQSTYGGGYYDAFVTKLNTTGNGLNFSTYLGGSTHDQAYDIVVDEDRHSHITGVTNSNNFPTYKAYDATFSGNYDIFVTKMNETGNGLKYSTFLGAGAYEEGHGIATDAVGNSYVTGYTASGTAFPLVNAYQSSYGGASDGFVTKISLDEDSPDINLLSPANNSAAQSGSTIDLDITDQNSGVSHVLYNWDGAPSNTTLAAPYDLTVPSGEVSHVLEVFANDSLDNWEDKIFVFITDDTDPVITLNSPANESIQAPGTIIDFTITDANGIDQVLYNWDYGNKFNLTSPYDLPLITGDGPHVLQIYALDPAGNRAEETLVYTTDGTGPIASLFNAANNSAHLAGTIIYLNFTEVTEVNHSYYKWDDDSLTPLAGPPYSVLLPAGDGPHVLLISANDSLGNWFNTIFVLYTDEGIPPTITLNSPTNDSIQVSGTIISFTIWDNTTISHVLYSWDGGANMTLTAPYDILLPSGDGSHILYIYANDSSNNWSYKRFVFTTDDTGPIIALNNPANATTHPSGTVISLSISDLNDVSYICYSWDNGPNITLNTPYNIALPTGNGLHILRVYANDSLGNWAMQVYVFTTQDITSTTSITTTSTTTPTPADFFTLEVFLLAFVVLSVIFWRRKDRKTEE
ncbi:MAG: SBBP repeat-containing protein [Candidatus Hermodarchaeota archaeon]